MINITTRRSLCRGERLVEIDDGPNKIVLGEQEQKELLKILKRRPER